jgi:hypothetical protein
MEENMKKNMLAFVLVMAILLGLTLACGGSATPTKTYTPQEDAWFACTYFIKDQLDLPYSDAQEFNPGRVKTLSSQQYLVTVLYAKYKSTYLCSLIHQTDGDWQLVSLDLIN